MFDTWKSFSSEALFSLTRIFSIECLQLLNLIFNTYISLFNINPIRIRSSFIFSFIFLLLFLNKFENSHKLYVQNGSLFAMAENHYGNGYMTPYIPVCLSRRIWNLPSVTEIFTRLLLSRSEKCFFFYTYWCILAFSAKRIGETREIRNTVIIIISKLVWNFFCNCL